MMKGSLKQVEPDGPTIFFQLNPQSMRFGGRSKRLDVISRPGRSDAAEWDGSGLRRVEFTLRLDGYPERPVGRDVLDLERMAGMNRPDRPPPKVRLNYGGQINTVFIIEQIERGPELRRDDLQVVRIDLDVALLEWVDAGVVVTPAQRAQSRAPSPPTGRTHVLAAGESLWSLAVRYFGDGNRWTDIARANGIRDPREAVPGLRLQIPDR